MTDQPPSQQPSDEPEGDAPASLASDDALTADAPTVVDLPAVSPPPPPDRPASSPSPPHPPAASPPPLPPPPSGEAGPAAARLESVFPPDRPERAVGAAFAGGFVLALILKRLAR